MEITTVFSTNSWGSENSAMKQQFRPFGNLVVKNPPANAGDVDSLPGPGRSHMARATKPVGRSCWALLQDKRSHCDERSLPAAGEQPPFTATG